MVEFARPVLVEIGARQALVFIFRVKEKEEGFCFFLDFCF